MIEIVDWSSEILPILDLIRENGVNPDLLRNLFIEKLNYDFIDKKALIEYPESIKNNVISTKIISEKGDFKVLFCEIDTLLKGIELPVVKSISGQYPANIIIFTNRDGDETHFINTKYVGKRKDEKKVKGFRRITIGKTDRLRTAAERLSKIYADDGISMLTLMVKCEEAFDVEAVSKEFYKEFVGKYKELRNAIHKNNRLSDNTTDDLTQNILNRLLFLYFIQKKGWLNNDYKFLYNNFNQDEKNYYKDFLVPLFKKLSIKDYEYSDFENIPFLNGGLFEFKEIEEKISIPNESFKYIFDDLLERFNFTIREDTEFEEEVAIDPEMLGKIFEELILSIESEKYKDVPDARRGSGSYYTPRFIVSFMVKQSLLNYLTNELPEISKQYLKRFVFDSSSDEINNPKVIKKKLLNLRIVDPGVGSGAFSVDILNKLVNLIEILNKKIGQDENRFDLRKKLIEDCIYGVDIQERAVHLARLRLWLSLIVDIDVEKIKDVPPLINLDFKIIKGDSLVSKICGFKFDIETPKLGNQKIIELIEKYKNLKDKYSEVFTNNKKRVLKEKINKTKCNIAIWHLEYIKNKYKQDLRLVDAQKELFEKSQRELKKEGLQKEEVRQRISDIEKEIKKIGNTQKIDTFNWYLDFFEVMGVKGGFDIVIANPPYGVAVDREVYKDEFDLGSKDSYGVFAALGVNILKSGGTLCYIMSDTWQTIRTHYKLRKKLFEETETQYLISVPMRTFKATVNTGIYLFKKSTIDKVKDNFIIASDFHKLDIKNGDLEAGFDMLMEENSFDKTKDGYTIVSDKEMAIYAYRQKIIKNFSNLSFFIASPKLFKLMNDTTNVDIFKKPPVIKVDFNDKEIELVKLGDIAKVVVGLQTGDNHYYLKQLPNTRGGYDEIDLNFVLKESELQKIRKDEKLRLDIIENGICINPDNKKHKSRYFGGRYFVPYDKGGASNIKEGWLPNYYVPTPFFINWSEQSVERLKTWKRPGATKIASRFQNKEFYFKEGTTISYTGYYAPMFRSKGISVFDVGGSSIFPSLISNENTIVILATRIAKLFSKCFIDSTVNFQIDEVKKIPIIYNIPVKYNQNLKQLVSSIIQNQKQEPRYDYMTNEQVEIDKLVYEMYNLNEDDIKEVENWYFRRYPKLSKTIEGKIKNDE